MTAPTTTYTYATPKADGLVDVCALTDLGVERGAGALVGSYQVAVFRLADDTVRVIQLHDPYAGANVLSRGIVGTHWLPGETEGEGAEVLILTSPIYKQVWNLDTGAVIDAVGRGEHPVAVFTAQVRDGRVLVDPEPSREPDLGSDH